MNDQAFDILLTILKKLDETRGLGQYHKRPLPTTLPWYSQIVSFVHEKMDRDTESTGNNKIQLSRGKTHFHLELLSTQESPLVFKIPYPEVDHKKLEIEVRSTTLFALVMWFFNLQPHEQQNKKVKENFCMLLNANLQNLRYSDILKEVLKYIQQQWLLVFLNEHDQPVVEMKDVEVFVDVGCGAIVSHELRKLLCYEISSDTVSIVSDEKKFKRIMENLPTKTFSTDETDTM